MYVAIPYPLYNLHENLENSTKGILINAPLPSMWHTYMQHTVPYCKYISLKSYWHTKVHDDIKYTLHSWWRYYSSTMFTEHQKHNCNLHTFSVRRDNRQISITNSKNTYHSWYSFSVAALAMYVCISVKHTFQIYLGVLLQWDYFSQPLQQLHPFFLD